MLLYAVTTFAHNVDEREQNKISYLLYWLQNQIILKLRSIMEAEYDNICFVLVTFLGFSQEGQGGGHVRYLDYNM